MFKIHKVTSQGDPNVKEGIEKGWNRNGGVERALASHQCGLGLIPSCGLGLYVGLSLFLVDLGCCSECFSPGTSSLHKNQKLQIPIQPG